MAEQGAGALHEGADLDAPDPALITTLDQLAEGLRNQRIAAGNPSYRQIAKMIADRGKPVPVATLHDAMGGKRMPKQELVLIIAEVLGSRNVSGWRLAWNRVERGRQNLAGPGNVTALPPLASTSSGTRTLDEIARIASVPTRQAASVIENAPIHQVFQVVDVLSAAESPTAAERLDLVAAERVAEVLTRMDERKAAAILANMHSPAAAQAMVAMEDPQVAGELLTRISAPPAARANILRQMPPDAGAAIISTIDKWPGFLGHVGLEPAAVRDLLMAMTDNDLQLYFSDPNNAPRGLQLFDGATPESIARMLRATSPDQAALWIQNSPADNAAEIISGLSDDEFRRIFTKMSPDRSAVGLHKALGTPHLLRLVRLLPATDIRKWIDPLQHHRLLTSDEYNQFRVAMREAMARPDTP